MCSFYRRLKGQIQPMLNIIHFGVIGSLVQSAITVINNAISDSLIVAKWVSETRKIKRTLHTSKSHALWCYSSVDAT